MMVTIDQLTIRRVDWLVKNFKLYRIRLDCRCQLNSMKIFLIFFKCNLHREIMTFEIGSRRLTVSEMQPNWFKWNTFCWNLNKSTKITFNKKQSRFFNALMPMFHSHRILWLVICVRHKRPFVKWKKSSNNNSIKCCLSREFLIEWNLTQVLILAEQPLGYTTRSF